MSRVIRKSFGRLRGPAWLLVAPLLGCPSGDDGSAETGAASGDEGIGTGSTTAPGTTSAADTGSTSASTTSGSSTGAIADPVQTCIDTCEHLVACEVEEVPNCGIPCTGVGGTIAGCEDVYVAQQQCVLALSCDDAQAWADAMGVGRGHPCAAEDMAFRTCIDGA